MFTRVTGLLIVPLWLASMGWLVAHDVWPGITAEDPPPLRVTEWLETEGREAQFAILNGQRKLGTIWTTYLIDEVSIQREDLIWIEHLPVDIAPLRVVGDSTFTVDGRLDEFTLRLTNDDTNIRLHGERFHADFSFTLEGTGLRKTKTFKLPLTDGGLISGAFNPFFQLTDLRIGRRWRMQVFNPVAAVTGLGDRFIPILLEVTARERIVTPGGEMNCFVVESSNTTAWVDPQGAVQVQEVELPVIGTIRIVREAGLDTRARAKARTASFRRREGK